MKPRLVPTWHGNHSLPVALAFLVSFRSWSVTLVISGLEATLSSCLLARTLGSRTWNEQGRRVTIRTLS